MLLLSSFSGYKVKVESDSQEFQFVLTKSALPLSHGGMLVDKERKITPLHGGEVGAGEARPMAHLHTRAKGNV